MASQSPDEKGLCHIHFWKSSAKTSYGHISFEVHGGVYISHWPSVCKNDFLSAIVGCPAMWYDTFQGEIDDIGYPSLTHHVEGLNVQAITDWWKGFRSGQRDWSLLRNSCSNIVHKALCVGRSDWFEGTIEGFATSPEAVVKLVENYNNDRKVKIVCVDYARSKKK